MSLVVEMEAGGRKAGRVCSSDYRRGRGCPLILRTTSEDLLTAEAFGILRHISPSLWLVPMLGRAFGPGAVASQVGRVDVRFWVPLPPPPLRSHIEGDSEVDVLVQFGETLLLVEAKYRAALSPGTKHDAARDQLVRLLDVAYQQAICDQMFPRQPYVLVLGCARSEPALVTRYRSAANVASALAHYHRYEDHERMASLLARRVGYLSWLDVARILDESGPSGNDTERAFMADVAAYLRHKVASVEPAQAGQRLMLPVVGSEGARHG